MLNFDASESSESSVSLGHFYNRYIYTHLHTEAYKIYGHLSS